MQFSIHTYADQFITGQARLLKVAAQSQKRTTICGNEQCKQRHRAQHCDGTDIDCSHRSHDDGIAYSNYRGKTWITDPYNAGTYIRMVLSEELEDHRRWRDRYVFTMYEVADYVLRKDIPFIENRSQKPTNTKTWYTIQMELRWRNTSPM